MTNAESANDVPIVNPDQLGASGIKSSMRSTVTKSFRSGTQAGFDEAGDPTKGMEELVMISSARAGNAASIVSTLLGEEPEDVKHFLCIPLTNNVKALFVMMVSHVILVRPSDRYHFLYV